jgi:hypothetical protein
MYASPLGWLSTNGQAQSTDTAYVCLSARFSVTRINSSFASSGNNAQSYTSLNVPGLISGIGRTPQSAPGQFIYNVDFSKEPTTLSNRNAAVVNAFYIVNTVHDIAVRRHVLCSLSCLLIEDPRL